MAQSGRSRIDSTPKVAGRHDLLIKVMMLDGEEKTLTVDVSLECKILNSPALMGLLLQRRAKAEVPINSVLQDLDIEEKEYFSLYYLDNNHRVSRYERGYSISVHISPAISRPQQADQETHAGW